MKKLKSATNYEKHVVKCPSCDKEVLDHMRKCPFCESDLPVLYQPMSQKAKKTVKIILWIILGAFGVALIVLKVLDII